MHKPADKCQSTTGNELHDALWEVWPGYTWSSSLLLQNYSLTTSKEKIRMWSVTTVEDFWASVAPLKGNGTKADRWHLDTVFKVILGLLREDGIRRKRIREVTHILFHSDFSHFPFMNLNIPFLLLLFLYSSSYLIPLLSSHILLLLFLPLVFFKSICSCWNQ